jgi:uncharacterized membrane protein HdeD (DUF308 family)
VKLYWVTLFRSLFATGLGVILLFQPDKTRPVLVNFMGMYWLMSGLISLRWSLQREGPWRLAFVAGIVGIVTGLLVLTRNLVTNWISAEVAMSFLGVIIILTGLMNISGSFRGLRKRPFSAILLGVFEVILGSILIISPLERGTFIYFAATIWALLGGFILLGDALHMRRQATQAAASEAA